MNLFNISIPKNSISMIFDAHSDAENYNTTLYLHKSKIILADESNEYSTQVELDLKQDTKKDKMVKQMFNKDYGSFILTFLNADFSSVENAYNTFFVYYGLEGLNYIDEIKEKYPIEYTTRYVSTKKFLDYYNKAFDLVNTDYIKFQNDIRKTVDFVFDLHGNTSSLEVDKYSKFKAYSTVVDLMGQFSPQIRLGIVKSLPKNMPPKMTTKQVYRADKKQKEQIKKEYLVWKTNARKQLKLYRENKISKEEFCDWIEKNK